MKITDEELRGRLAERTPRPPPYTRGALGKYIKLVQPAAPGAVTE